MKKILSRCQSCHHKEQEVSKGHELSMKFGNVWLSLIIILGPLKWEQLDREIEVVYK